MAWQYLTAPRQRGAGLASNTDATDGKRAKNRTLAREDVSRPIEPVGESRENT
jgi:hypothetical protein